jgi:toxin YxiD
MKNTVIDLIDEANGYMNEVNDIVCLTRLDDQRFMHGLKKAERLCGRNGGGFAEV